MTGVELAQQHAHEPGPHPVELAGIEPVVGDAVELLVDGAQRSPSSEPACG